MLCCCFHCWLSESLAALPDRRWFQEMPLGGMLRECEASLQRLGTNRQGVLFHTKQHADLGSDD